MSTTLSSLDKESTLFFRFDKKKYCIHPAVMCLRWMANNHRISFALFQSPTNQGLGVHMDGQ